MIICDHCNEVIGVYEPAVVVIDGKPAETSQAAEPGVLPKATERYHRDCYKALTSPQN